MMKPTLSRILGITVPLLAFIALSAKGAPVKIELPPESGVYKQAPGVEFANAQCLTCHSSDYVAIQPVFGRKYWKATVEKMQAKFGAPIPPDQIDALVTYLVTTYGDEKK